MRQGHFAVSNVIFKTKFDLITTRAIIAVQNPSPFEPRHQKNRIFAYAKTKTQISFRGNREADQRLCFRYLDSTIPLLPKSKISSL